MCGICGIYDFKNKAEKWRQTLGKSNLLLKNRGPDNEGIFIEKNIGLAHTRLSVIDTSEAANQPLTDFTNQYTIIFNGEFYDYQIHRNILEKKGYKFKTQSDTEVLLNMFIDKGESFLSEINGCFSLAIYNKKDESLFIARDRFGIKPLVFYVDNDKIIFASEIKAILAFNIPKLLNSNALQLYLYLNYIPAPLTIFEKINKLLPGHFIKVVKNTIEIKQYYCINNKVNNEIKIIDAVDVFRNLLENSVKRRLVSDVPVGTFLSGGIDSSVITAIASKYSAKLNTFSVGFKEDKFYDETSSAQIIANKFNTNHTVFSLSRNDLLNEVAKVLDYLDEPFADSSAIAVSALCGLTKQFVTVALSGDGADELHAGYNKHYAHYLAINGGYKNLIAKSPLPFLSILPKSRNSNFSNKVRQAQRYGRGLSKNDKERYWYWSTFAEDKYVNNLLKSNNNNYFNKNKSDSYRIEILKNVNSDFNSILLTDMNLVLPNDMLFKVDMMSMMHGLEVRVPMLDHTIVDYVFSLPAAFKIDKSSRKKLLRLAFADLLPPEIIEKPKHGFEVPLLPWLRNELKPMIDDLLNETFISSQNIFNYCEIKKQKKLLHSVSPSESPVHLWNLLVFQIWWNKYFN